MDEAVQAEVKRLLAEGLDHYGEDDIGKAIGAWRSALDLDKRNSEALDYIQTADRRDQRRLPIDEQLSDGARQIVHGARGLIEQSDWEGALDLLVGAGDVDSAPLEYQATIELVRSALVREYGERVGRFDTVPRLRDVGADLTGYNLPSDAGFVISLIDGSTPLGDIVSLSGMDAFEVLRLVTNLLDAELVEIRD